MKLPPNSATTKKGKWEHWWRISQAQVKASRKLHVPRRFLQSSINFLWTANSIRMTNFMELIVRLVVASNSKIFFGFSTCLLWCYRHIHNGSIQSKSYNRDHRQTSSWYDQPRAYMPIAKFWVEYGPQIDSCCLIFGVIHCVRIFLWHWSRSKIVLVH